MVDIDWDKPLEYVTGGVGYPAKFIYKGGDGLVCIETICGKSRHLRLVSAATGVNPSNYSSSVRNIPTPDVVKIMRVHRDYTTTQQVSHVRWDNTMYYAGRPCADYTQIKLVYDGDTGKLKSVSIDE